MIKYIPTNSRALRFEPTETEVPITGYVRKYIVPKVEELTDEPPKPEEVAEEVLEEPTSGYIVAEPTPGTITYKKDNIDVGNMQEVLDRFAQAGISVRVSSGKRKPGEAGKAGSKSHHTTGNAIDITPGEGET